jgi:hypothetical protein
MATTTPTVIGCSFTGSNGGGSCAAAGMKVGDKIFWVWAGGDCASAFERVVTVADEVQQLSSGDLSGTTFELLAAR